jgi:DNA-binding transcriptional MocR family regulator
VEALADASVAAGDLARLVALLGRWSDGSGALYLKLASRLAGLIEQGEIAADERLPPERVLAGELAVSRTTAAAAYEVLRGGGLVERRRGSGTWVLRPSRPRRTAAGGFNPMFLALLDANRGLIDTTCAASTPSGVLAEVLDDAFAAAARTARVGAGYFPAGLPELREAIAARYSAQGLPTAAEEVVVTSGAQQALSLLAQLLLAPGDVVGVEAPTYPGALDVFVGAGARIRGLRVTRDGVCVDELEELVERAAPRLIYLIPTFQNPTGAVLPPSARRRLLRAIEPRRVAVIDDQVLSGLAFDGAPTPGPLASYGQPGSVLSVGSLSKLVWGGLRVGWGGLRVGWVRADCATVAQIARLKAVSDLGNDVLSQMVALALFERLDEVLAVRRRQLGECCEELVELLRGSLAEWELDVPQGGQTLWVRLPGCDTRRFAQVALRHGVGVLEESSLRAGDSRGEHLRLPLTLPAELVPEAVARLADAWREYRGLASAGDQGSR